MQLEDIRPREVSQAQKDQLYMFSLICEWQTQKIHICTDTSIINTNSYVEHICNSGTSLWNLEKEGKEERMIEPQRYHKQHLWR
jgi:hypothetical protein